MGALIDRPSSPDFLVTITKIHHRQTGEDRLAACVPAVPEVGSWWVNPGATYASVAFYARSVLAKWIGVELEQVRAHVGHPIPAAAPPKPGP